MSCKIMYKNNGGTPYCLEARIKFRTLEDSLNAASNLKLFRKPKRKTVLAEGKSRLYQKLTDSTIWDMTWHGKNGQ